MLEKTEFSHQCTLGKYGVPCLSSFSSRLKGPKRQVLCRDGFQTFSIWPDVEHIAAAQ